MAANEPKRRGWTMTAAFVVGAMLFLFLVVLPGKKHLQQLREAVRQQRQYIVMADSMRPLLQEQRQQLARAEEAWEGWNAAAPGDGQVSALFEEIHNRLKGADTTVTRFDPLEPIEMRTLGRRAVALGATGSFQQLFAALSSLEQLPAVWIEEIRLEAPRAAGRDEVSLEAKLLLFSSKMEKTKATGEARPVLSVNPRLLVRSISRPADN